MVDITLFELHLDGSEFTANAPGIGKSDEEGDESDSGNAPLGLVAGLVLVVFVVIAVVAVKKRGGSDGGESPLDDAE
ncbi:hypothetical protein BRC96_02815 [Halobacteriales archaeon QS_6_64_34]|nr:MAG: hypothetical protein BRC96_02815 [Halobacteriales archaeon QS_6_64_34]